MACLLASTMRRLALLKRSERGEDGAVARPRVVKKGLRRANHVRRIWPAAAGMVQKGDSPRATNESGKPRCRKGTVPFLNHARRPFGRSLQVFFIKGLADRGSLTGGNFFHPFFALETTPHRVASPFVTAGCILAHGAGFRGGREPGRGLAWIVTPSTAMSCFTMKRPAAGERSPRGRALVGTCHRLAGPASTRPPMVNLHANGWPPKFKPRNWATRPAVTSARGARSWRFRAA